MIRRSFNDGWTVAPKASAFESLGTAATGTPVQLPHDGMRDLERTAVAENGASTGWYPGVALRYTKRFDVPAHWWDRSVTVQFDGVYRDAVVLVNGDFVAQRPHGYTAFSIELSPYLRPGEQNLIEVDARSHRDSRWYSGTGIHRDVWLMVADQVHVELDGVRITTPEIDAELATVTVAVAVVNCSHRTRTVRVQSDVLTLNDVQVATGSAPITLLPGESADVHLRLYVSNPLLWGVDQPNLYRMRTLVMGNDGELDRDLRTFGIRKVQVDPTRGLRINGAPVTLRGGCVHHDNGPLGAATIARAEERRVEIMKAAGYNAIRSAHNPISRALLDACDRLGMLVIDELTDVWTEGKTQFDSALTFPEWWERDLESMVVKDFNHPSVIMYSIGNEIFEVGRPIGSRWGRLLAERVRSLDSTRIVTNAINGFVAALDLLPATGGSGDVNAVIAQMSDAMNALGASEEVSVRTEEAHSQLDVSGINYAEARYAIDAVRHPDRIEYGSESFPGALDRLWPLVKQHPHVIGDFAWTAWDYLGEAGVGRAVYDDDPARPTGISSPYPWLTANCGTIDITGFRRPIAYWREIVWGTRAQPYIAVHRPQRYGIPITVGPWSWDDVVSSWSWSVPEGTPIVVDVYADADEVELRIDGEPIARAGVGLVKDFIARFDTTYRVGALSAVAFQSGEEVGLVEIHSATGPTILTARADRDRLLADPVDLAFIDIALEDSIGVVVTDVPTAVTLRLDGPGAIVGYASGRPNPTERFDAVECTTYDGRLLAILRPTGAGAITLTAASTEFGTAEVIVVAGGR